MREVARPARDDVLEESCSPAKGLEDGASSCGDGSATGRCTLAVGLGLVASD